MKRNLFIATLMLNILIPFLVYGSNGNDILGKWVTADKDAVIEFYKCGNKYCGRIVWAKEPEKKDIHNPDPLLRNRPLLGATLFTGFVYAGNNEWKKGRVYNPDNGKKYKCILKMDSKGRLKVRGYILCPIFGKTTVWKRLDSITKIERRNNHG